MARSPVTWDGHAFAFDPVVDTLYMSHEGGRPAPWMWRLLERCDAHPGVRMRIAGDGRVLALGEPATGSLVGWVARRGMLKGFGSYPYTLHGVGPWAGVTVLMAPPQADGEVWRWYVMLRAERLWRAWFDGREAIDVAQEVADQLVNRHRGGLMAGDAIPLRLWKVSRIDVCRDHGQVHEWTQEDLTRFARRGSTYMHRVSGGFDDQVDTPAGLKDAVEADAAEADGDDVGEAWVFRGRASHTFYLGKRRSESCMLRLYPKDVEAEASGKAAWLVPFWRWALLGDAHAQGPLARIWRAEVEHGGGWCRAHGLETADKLRGVAWALWGGYTSRVRHVGDVSREHMRHAVPSRAWRLLQTGTRSDRRGWRYQPKPPSTGGNPVQLFKQAVGCMASLMERVMAAQAIVDQTPDEDAILAELIAAMDKELDHHVADVRERYRAALIARHRGGADPPQEPRTVTDIPTPERAPRGTRGERLKATATDAEDLFAAVEPCGPGIDRPGPAP